MPKSKKPKRNIKQHKDRGIRGQETAARRRDYERFERGADQRKAEQEIRPCLFCKGKMQKFKDLKPLSNNIKKHSVEQYRCSACWPRSFNIVRPKPKKLPDFVRAEKIKKPKKYVDDILSAEQNEWLFTWAR